MDVDTINPGEDVLDVIRQRVGSCDALIALIGERWLTAAHAEHRRRLDDPEDVARLEIAAALERKIAVIPLLVGAATMPSERQLPEVVRPLARRQALALGTESFRRDVVGAHLVNVLSVKVMANGDLNVYMEPVL